MGDAFVDRRGHAACTFLIALGLSLTLSSASEGGLRPSRRMDHAEGEYIWGSCDPWTHNVTGCSLDNGYECSSNLSPGPEDADVEINITHLPPSLPGKEAHLSWWAPRKSEYEYSPLVSPNGCAVFWNMLHAYPQHDAADFNGGNARISEDGKATIRVRQPSTYKLSRWILFPHIHLRICTGDNFAHANPDTIFFTPHGPVFTRGYHGQNHTAAAEMLENAAYLDGHVPNPQPTTTSTLAPTDTSQEGNPMGQMPDGMDDGNDEGVLLTNTSGLDDLRLQDAKDALDLDALEFSPVYQCLLEDSYFSYFSSNCVETCPADSAVYVGQCVRPDVSDTEVTLKAIWGLDLSCDTTCWHDKLTVTLHHIRIAVADQLEIPFQEVDHASLGLVEATSRRLSDGSEVKEARMQVMVKSKRVSVAQDLPRLQALLSQPSDAAWLLGFDVHGVSTVPAAEWKESGYTIITDDTDPYSTAYREEVKGKPVSHSTPVLPMEMLPVEAIIGIAIGIVLLGSIIGFRLWYKRRKMAAAAAEGQVPYVTGRPAKSADDDGPTKPSTVGAPTADDDDYPRKPHQQGGAGAGVGVAAPDNAATYGASAAAAAAGPEAADGSRI